MTAYLDSLTGRIDAQLTSLREQVARLEAARAVLVAPRKPRGRPRGGRSAARPTTQAKPRNGRRKPARGSQAPALQVVRLAPAPRPHTARPHKIAAVDDVLAALTLGHDNPQAVATHLDASVVSVVGRLRDLMREGLVTHSAEGYRPVARNLPNWVEPRARELAG